MGLVKSVNPMKVELKPNAKLPKQTQYQLKPEAEEGKSKTISGLMEVKTQSPCTTPIYPLLEADKSKYRMVHYLRMINEVVQDWPAEVPLMISVVKYLVL